MGLVHLTLDADAEGALWALLSGLDHDHYV